MRSALCAATSLRRRVWRKLPAHLADAERDVERPVLGDREERVVGDALDDAERIDVPRIGVVGEMIVGLAGPVADLAQEGAQARVVVDHRASSTAARQSVETI